MNKLKFTQDGGSLFYKELNKKIENYFTENRIHKTGNGWMYLKILFFFLCFGLSYSVVITTDNIYAFFLAYILVGVLVLNLIFNIAHDAAHNSIFKDKLLNKILYYISFILLGNNPYVWKKYHIKSHHLYTNVEGSDIDVIYNSLLRLHVDETHKPYHRYQHIYAPFIYLFYSINFVFLRDLLFLFKRKDRSIEIEIPLHERVLYAIYKLVYFSYTLLIPMYFSSFSFGIILLAFFLTHFISSWVIVGFLACNHQVDLISHYGIEESKELKKSWATLQMETSLDYNPDSRLFNFFLGGFNAHTVHHLLPEVCHIHYPNLIGIVREVAKKHNITYHETNFSSAIKSHFRFLKHLGSPNQ